MARILTYLLIPLLAILLTAHVEFNFNNLLSTADTARVLLLTAHPDDECMFFGPTLTALKRRSEQEGEAVEVHSLCLSVGDADGLGEVRRWELVRSLDVLGVDAGRRRVLDREDMKDDITATWDPHTIADIVTSYASAHNITTILTFDERGVSSHPNHISLFRGTALALALAPQPLRAYALVSSPLLTKYLGVASAFVAKVRVPLQARSDNGVDRAMVVSSAAEYAVTLRGMLQHWSQMVWFRWLYVGFSRYMWVNEWVEIKSAASLETGKVAEL
ncbi:hypothetical protein GLOTRDRAFT_108705 [Gloeophyllum trabeum ATCC 11539]|uniref:N-acetylglucosaminylphosphatidylinositol deacetylase n=1 Tax=Gloeophyllum trabeum (strain ATCC 11539 / FP-39264 / Madison 617) TaxID=670483 RepID=S7PS01_GLOTA|nr:uncharacterized protein GLOTRDRAFT_108705 [Gloeophyllum trabeum ATCC 11539]EPQ50152.1 hypothetical protein GLOTRDRAFT_108705 [Gloeophyllum trabeum ATCC 11539]